MNRVQTIALWIAAVSLGALAVFSGLSYFAAESHRAAEVEEWQRIQDYQRGAPIVNGSGSDETVVSSDEQPAMNKNTTTSVDDRRAATFGFMLASTA